MGTPEAMPPTPVARADALLGDAIEATVQRHHRRRLRRLGHGGVLDPPPRADDTLCATGDPPPRPGCRLEVLVDGADRAAARSPRRCRHARSHVHLTGWHLASHFELVRGEPPLAIGPLLAELAERVDVRVMVWAGSPVPLFHPTRKEVEAEVDTPHARHQDPGLPGPARAPGPLPPREDDRRRRRGRVRQRHRPDRPGRRPLRHLRPPGAPQARLARRRHADRGPGGRRRRRALRDALARGRGRDAAAADRPRRPSRGSTHVHRPGRPHRRRGHVRRGPARATSGSWRPTSARCAPPSTTIYLENQFLWSPEIVAILATSSGARRATTSGSSSCCPAKANNGQDDTRGQLGVLADADGHEQPALPRRDDPLADRRPRRPAVRPRQGRHRRRPLADDRLGQPQRPLAAQRHRDERRHRRRGAGPRDARAPVGRAPRVSRWTRSPAAPPARVVDDALAPDRDGAAAPPRRRRAADAPPDRPPGRVEAVAPAARPAAGLADDGWSGSRPTVVGGDDG